MTSKIVNVIASHGHRHIVPLRATGTGLPLFCFPGSGGNVYAFGHMASALPEGNPVYGIDLEWLAEVDEPFTIEQLAAAYLERIREVQRFGPYFFCGYSFGGLIAYELAQQLHAEGEVASLVALLDTPNPAMNANLSRAESAEFLKTYMLDRLKRYALQLVRGDLKSFMRRGSAFVGSRFGRVSMPLVKTAYRISNRPLPRHLRARDPRFLNAWRSYVPKPYDNTVVCFRVDDRGPEYDRDPSLGWDACVKGGVQVHVVPGEHAFMMAMPAAGVIAEKLAPYLDRGST